MARNSHTSEAVPYKAVRSAKLHSERRSLSVAKKTAWSRSTSHAAPVQDMKTFEKAISEWRHLVKSAQQQIEILVDLNIVLRKEITMLVQKETQACHSAYHDGLTGLPNRNLLQDRFHQAKSLAKRQHKPLSLLLLDLDNFKHVNDRLGHASGDKLLQAVALRITKSIRSADTACRYGGDEFVIMLPIIDSPNVATALAIEINRRLCEPYIIDDHIVHMAVSIGMAVYPGDGQTFDNLIKHADIAMYRSKGTGHSTYISEQPNEDVDKAEANKQPATKKAGRTHERDLLVQKKLVSVQGQQKKHQQM